MKEKLMKMMGEKKKLSPIEQKAKMGVLEQLKKDMQDMMGEKVAGLKKVTVASNDPHGLEAGLDKAKALVQGHSDEHDPLVEGAEEDMGEDLDHDQEEGESPEHQEKVLGHQDHMAMALGHDESPEESEEGEDDEAGLDAKIQELLKKKASLKK